MIQYLNIASNSIMTISLVIFIILIFGRNESIVHKLHKAEYWMLKIGLAASASGALFSALTNPLVTWTQFLRNAGLALLFVWAVVFHYRYFIKEKTNKSNELIKNTSTKKKTSKKKK